MNIAFIGFGNVAYALACGLHDNHTNTMRFYKRHYGADTDARTQERVQEAQAVFCQDYAALLKDADVVFACVVGKHTLDVAQESVPYLTAKHLYIDLNTAPPHVKKQTADLVQGTGARYVDGAIMGPVESLKHAVPIMASGEGVQAFMDIFTPLGMNITRITGEAGRAASIKLVRTVFQKGLAALFIETLLAARAFDSQDILLESIAATMDGESTVDTAARLVTKGLLHSQRMQNEVANTLALLKEHGIDDTMTRSTFAVYSKCLAVAKEHNLQNTTPLTLKEALDLF